MTEVLYITERSGQVADGYANGLTNRQLGKALYLDENTIGSHSKALYSDLGIGSEQYANPRYRAISMLKAADVLKPSDQKLPGAHYRSTMQPSPHSPIQYSSHVPSRYCTPPTLYMPSRYKKELENPAPIGEVRVSWLERTMLAYASLGRSAAEMVDAGIGTTHGSVDYRAVKLIKSLGVLNLAHAVAFGLHYGLIEVKPEILTPGRKVKPIHYTAGRTIFIARQAYTVPTPRKRSSSARKAS